MKGPLACFSRKSCALLRETQCKAGPLAAALASFARLCLGSEVQDKVDLQWTNTVCLQPRWILHQSGRHAYRHCIDCTSTWLSIAWACHRALAPKSCVLCWMLGNRLGVKCLETGRSRKGYQQLVGSPFIDFVLPCDLDELERPNSWR